MYRFVEEKFSVDMKQTVGMAFLTKVMEVSGTAVKVQVWDTAGQVGFAGHRITYRSLGEICERHVVLFSSCARRDRRLRRHQ